MSKFFQSFRLVICDMKTRTREKRKDSGLFEKRRTEGAEAAAPSPMRPAVASVGTRLIAERDPDI
jgi:hypothetical protein